MQNIKRGKKYNLTNPTIKRMKLTYQVQVIPINFISEYSITHFHHILHIEHFIHVTSPKSRTPYTFHFTSIGFNRCIFINCIN